MDGQFPLNIVIIIVSILLIILVLFVILFLFKERTFRQIFDDIVFSIRFNLHGGCALLQDIFTRSNNVFELTNQTGKIVVITGGTRGIGASVVKLLMQCDAHVIMGCRKIQAGEHLLQKIRNEGVETGTLTAFTLDTSEMKSVEEFARNVNEKCSQIHVLINNAAIIRVPYKETSEGFESQFATNYLGHFYLIHLLLQKIIQGGEPNRCARIINVASSLHKIATISFGDINFMRNYNEIKPYCQSKLCQVVFTNHLDSLFKKDGIPVEVFSVHPGIVNTESYNKSFVKTFLPCVIGWLFKTPEQAAITILFVVFSNSLEGKGGSYIANCMVQRTKNEARSKELQEKLFSFSNNLLKIDNYIIT